MLPKLIIKPLPAGKLVVGALFHHLPLVEDDHLVIFQDAHDPVSDDHGRLCGQFPVEKIDDDVLGMGVNSRKAVNCGCLINARAIDILCFWPPDRVIPLSPIRVLKPSGRETISS